MQSYKEVGQLLKDRRIQLKLDMRDVAHQLHIRAKYLTALEQGDLDVMPGKVYARGYLRQYAQFLGLNAHEIGEVFDRLVSERHVKYFVPEPTSRSYQPGPFLVVAALAAVFVIYLYWYRTHKEILLPPGHEMVSPVPERLLNPILPPEEAQEELTPSDILDNHEVFIGPPAFELPQQKAPEHDIEPPALEIKPLQEELPWLKSGATNPAAQ